MVSTDVEKAVVLNTFFAFVSKTSCIFYVPEPLSRTPHLVYWGPRTGRMWSCWNRRMVTKMIRWLDHLSYENRLRELGLLSLEKALGDLTMAFWYWKGAYRQERDRICTQYDTDKEKWL